MGRQSQGKPKSPPKPKRAAGRSASAAPTVSGRWIVAALLLTLLAASACVWGALCLMFWRGSWQLLYHPTATVTRTPAKLGLAFETIPFDATQSGVPRLTGWWIPASTNTRYTVLYLHGADGNMSNALDELALVHQAGLQIFTFDYRGYGQSLFVPPSEQHWREDAEAAIAYLTGTRHIDQKTLIVAGQGLGADLAVEVAARHPELGGVLVDSLLDSPVDRILQDARARLVPARWLISDRWNVASSAATMAIPSLWLCRHAACLEHGADHAPDEYALVPSRKTIVWLTRPDGAQQEEMNALAQWIDSFGTRP